MGSPAEIIGAYLREHEIRHERPSESDWTVQLRGEKKLSTTVLFAVRERTLAVEAFFMRRPNENHAEFYRMLLRANMRTYAIRFAVDDVGDVYLVARIPLASVTEEELDRVLGAILTTAEETFMPAIEVGFASYLQRDMAWRAAQTQTPR